MSETHDAARVLNDAVRGSVVGQRVLVAWRDGLGRTSQMFVTVQRVGDTVTVADEFGNPYTVWDTFGGPAIAGNPIEKWEVRE